ncbi:MAG: hypothetical protein LBV17_05110, partial [Treponema sp.]|nr:hypothetical protein [Treponema sp.]
MARRTQRRIKNKDNSLSHKELSLKKTRNLLTKRYPLCRCAAMRDFPTDSCATMWKMAGNPFGKFLNGKL